jgi:hypothetical protein
MPKKPLTTSHTHLLEQCKTPQEKTILLAYVHHLTAQTAHTLVKDELTYQRVAEIYRAYKLLDTPKLSSEQLVKAMVRNASSV